MNRPSPRRDGVLQSRVLPKEIEAELRVDVLDGGFIPRDGNPQIIIVNQKTGCRGHYYPKGSGGEEEKKFVFWHDRNQTTAECACLVKSAADTDLTWEVPDELENWRLWLITELHLEPKFVAMVLIKLYLGMYVPEPLNGLFEQEEEIECVTEGDANQ